MEDQPVLAEPVPVVAELAAAKPWGLWATIGLSLGVGVAFVAIETAAVIGYDVASGWTRGAADLSSNGLLLSLATWTSMPICLVLIGLLVKLRGGWTTGDYLALRPVRARELLGWLAILVAFVAVSDGMSYLLGRALVPLWMRDVYRTAYFTPLLWATLLVAAPVFEETFFRGFMFRGIRHSRLGPAGAVLLTALAWTVMHTQYDFFTMGQIFAGGVLLGLARLKSQSLYVPLAMHSAANFVATVEVVVDCWLSGAGRGVAM